jgi:hypothetical protein
MMKKKKSPSLYESCATNTLLGRFRSPDTAESMLHPFSASVTDSPRAPSTSGSEIPDPSPITSTGTEIDDTSIDGSLDGTSPLPPGSVSGASAHSESTVSSYISAFSAGSAEDVDSASQMKKLDTSIPARITVDKDEPQSVIHAPQGYTGIVS